MRSVVLGYFESKATVLDCGVSTAEPADYPDVALRAAAAVSEGQADAGVLMCGTGIGMALAANKVKGVRAASCFDAETARLAKAHNNLNILCLGGRFLSPDRALAVLDAWHGASFEGGRHLARVNKIAAAEAVTFSSGGVVIFNHPLVHHKMTIIRDKNTSVKEFRELVEEVAGLMVYEITRNLPLSETRVETPMASAAARTLAGKKLAVVPVLRAGLGMVNGILSLIPNAKVGHIGLYRDPNTLEPVEYYCKLPQDIQEREIFVADPMLATGGTAVAALSLIKARGGRKISLVCLVAAPEGVKRVHEAHPDVGIFIAALDPCLDDHGYIVPGLGDAGDRLFGSK